MLKTYIQIFKYSDKGLIYKSRKKLSRSFIKAFMGLLYGRFSGENIGSTFVTVEGSVASNQGTSYSFYSAGASDSLTDLTYTYTQARRQVGIHLGTGTAAVQLIDRAMAIEIAKGTGTGELEYLGTTGTETVVSAPNASFTLEAYFRNGSGGSIDINEMGVYSSSQYSSVSWRFCIIRDLVSPAVTIADSEYLKVVYTFTITA